MPSAADKVTVQAQLGRILSNTLFANSPRLSRFLKFVVEKTLAGSATQIKEYVVAIEVFDKPENYDPQADSTVRTEASKLRSRIARYYETEGRDDDVIISIPKGTYVPVFEQRRGAVAVRPMRGFAWRIMIAGGTALALTITAFIWQSRRSPAPQPTLVPLTSYPEAEEHASLSPDGSQVAFRWKGDIYVKQIGTETVLQLTRDPATDDWPAWSPDCGQIAFVRGGEVFLVPSAGGVERKVAKSAGRVAWTPDASALLVLTQTSAYARSIFRINLATGQSRRLTFPDDDTSGDLDMAVSPDGSIAFCRTLTGEGCDLHVIPAAGGESLRLTDDRRVIQGFAWTPDGRQIVFSSNRRAGYRLWRVGVRSVGSAGSYDTPVLLAGAGDDARYPSTARGARLVYQRYTWNFDIARAEIVGRNTAAHRLKPSTPLITSTRNDVTPSWSPDGARIAFRSDRSGTPEIWVCDADGSKPLKLTSFGGPNVMFPRWSPNGQRLVFSALTGPGGNFESYFIGTAGGAPERIRTPGHPSMVHVVFSHDGRWIYFIPGPKEGSVHAWRIPAAGGEAVQITSGDAFRPEESADGKLLYYGRMGTHGLWSTPVTGGEAWQVMNSITEMNWTVTPTGIYYFDFKVAPDARKPVKFYSFKSGSVTQVGTVESTVSRDFAGISVSPDGRWLLYSHIAHVNSDLMLVDYIHW